MQRNQNNRPFLPEVQHPSRPRNHLSSLQLPTSVGAENRVTSFSSRNHAPQSHQMNSVSPRPQVNLSFQQNPSLQHEESKTRNNEYKQQNLLRLQRLNNAPKFIMKQQANRMEKQRTQGVHSRNLSMGDINEMNKVVICQMINTSGPLDLQKLLEILRKTVFQRKPHSLFQRILAEVEKSKRQAFVFYEFLIGNWDIIWNWVVNDNSVQNNRTLIKIISAIIGHAMQDSDPKATQKSKVDQNRSKQRMTTERSRQPLANITSEVNNSRPAQISQSLMESYMQNQPNIRRSYNQNGSEYQVPHPSSSSSVSRNDGKFQSTQAAEKKKYFDKAHLIHLVRSKHLSEIIALYCHSIQKDKEGVNGGEIALHREALTQIVSQVADSLISLYQKQNVYDQFSLKYLHNGVFHQLLKLFDQDDMSRLDAGQFHMVARVLEFCSTSNDGIKLILRYQKTVFELLALFFQDESDEKTVLYAAATVLLDLTANEQCIEQVATEMMENEMFPFVVRKLESLIQRRPSDNSEQKLRDLFIGIVLNLTCNVENQQTIMHLIKETNIIGALLSILVDSRHDWPTNGAALALLQYGHLSMQESDIFDQLQESRVRETLAAFLNRCTNRQAQQYMYETLTIIEMCSKKIGSIERIIENQVFASCA